MVGHDVRLNVLKADSQLLSNSRRITLMAVEIELRIEIVERPVLQMYRH